MRLVVCSLAGVVAAAAVVAAQTAAPDPNAVLAAARAALGGDARIAAVKTLTATGRTRQVRGDNLVPIEFQVSIEFPNKYLRKDEVPAQESGPTSTGFNDDTLLELPTPAPPAGRPGGPPPPTPEQLAAGRAARLGVVKQDFARLMLGLFASSYSGYPLTFTYAGQAEAPQGMADVLEGKGENLTLRLFVLRDTHLPVMVTWTGPAPGRGRGPSPPAPPAGAPPAAGTPPVAPPENRLFFADYREVDGLKFPFRLRRALGADTIEETTFDRFRINPKIDAKTFEVRK